jgi:hypothetical protein
MKNEIPASRTNAPTAMAATLPPLRLPPPVDVVIGATVVGVATVGVCDGDTGRPGVNGFCVLVP